MAFDYNQKIYCRICRPEEVSATYMARCVGRNGAVVLRVSSHRQAHSKRWSLVKAHLRPSVCHGLPSPRVGAQMPGLCLPPQQLQQHSAEESCCCSYLELTKRNKTTKIPKTRQQQNRKSKPESH